MEDYDFPDEYYDFLEKLKNVKAIKCNRWNAMSGDLLYHVLDIYDDEYIATKYYGKHKQWWHYRFFNAYQIWNYYQQGWIELREK